MRFEYAWVILRVVILARGKNCGLKNKTRNRFWVSTQTLKHSNSTQSHHSHAHRSTQTHTHKTRRNEANSCLGRRRRRLRCRGEFAGAAGRALSSVANTVIQNWNSVSKRRHFIWNEERRSQRKVQGCRWVAPKGGLKKSRKISG